MSVRYWGVPKRAPKEPGGFGGRLCRRRTRNCDAPLQALNTGIPEDLESIGAGGFCRRR